MSEVELSLRMPVQVLAAVAGDDLEAEAVAVRLASNPDRPPLVKVVYEHSKTAAWISSDRIIDGLDQARLVDVAHGARQCSECGCTDGVACAEGCGWASSDPWTCTSCAGAPAAEVV